MASVPFSLARDGRKTCSKCLTEKQVGEFYPDARKQDGLRPTCKTCFRANLRPPTKRATPAQKAAYARRIGQRLCEYVPLAERIAAAAMKRRLRAIERRAADEARADAERAWSEWLARAPWWWIERRNTALAAEAQKHKDRERERYRNTDRARLRSAWRAAKHTKRIKRKDQADGTLAREGFDALYRAAKRCLYCGCRMTTRQPLGWRSTDATLDHMVALSLGGIHGTVNAVICCASCNFKKRDMPFTDWLDRLSADGAARARREYRRRYGCDPEQAPLL